MSEIFTVELGIGLQRDGLVANLEDDDGADEVARELAVVASGVSATDGDDGRGELAGLDEGFVAAIGVFERLGPDGDTEGVDGIAVDGGDFGRVEVSFKIATVTGVSSDVNAPGLGVFEVKRAVVGGAGEYAVRDLFTFGKFSLELVGDFFFAGSDGSVNLRGDVGGGGLVFVVIIDGEAGGANGGEGEDDDKDGL